MCDVHVAPDAAWLSRGKARGEAHVIELLSYSIDPSKAERFVERLRIGDSALPGILPVEANPKLGRGGVILRQPAPEVGTGLEELQATLVDFH